LARDEYGVQALNIFYNGVVGISFCVMDAPDNGALEKQNEKYGIKCAWTFYSIGTTC
jgi:hypothetical protein